MGDNINNGSSQGNQANQDAGIQIVDLGTRSTDGFVPVEHHQTGLSVRGRVVLGGGLAVLLATGLTLLPSLNEVPPPEHVEPPVEALDACQTVDRARKQEAADPAGQGEASPPDIMPPGYTLYGVMTSNTETTLIGLIHPDQTLQICEEVARSAPFTVRFPTEAELGQLPDDMSYAYDSSGSFSENTLTIRLKGVRLEDGTITESVTLADGRTVPSAVPAKP